MQQKQINFQPLESLPKYSSFLASFGPKLIIRSYWTIFVAIILIPFLLIYTSNGLGAALLALAGFVIFAALILFYFDSAIRRYSAQTIRAFSSFAAANSFSYVPDQAFTVENGSLFKEGQSRHENNIFEGDINNIPFKLATYHYEKQQGKTRYFYNILYMRLSLPQELPQMVIDCLVEAGENGDSTLPIEFDKAQRIQLEGDFYKYFDVYAPDKFAINALTVIAPDVMDTLMRMEALCDIEIIGKEIYFYWPNEKATKSNYEAAFNTVVAVMNETFSKLSRSDLKPLSAKASINTSSPEFASPRLKRQKYGLATLAGIIIFLLLEFSSNITDAMGIPQESLAGALPTILFFLLCMGLVLWSIYASYRKRELAKDLKARYSKGKNP